MNVEDYIADAPLSARGILALAFSGESRAAAIKAKCLTCSNYERAEAAGCRVFTCPLHPYRPYRRPWEQGGAPEPAVKGGLSAIQGAVDAELSDAGATPVLAAPSAENINGAGVVARAGFGEE